MLDVLYQIDVILFRIINQSISCDFLDWLVLFVTDKYFIYLLTIATAIYLIRKYKLDGIMPIVIAILAIAVADAIGFRILRPLFCHPRPCLIPEATAIPLLGRNTSYGMPSLHATHAFVLASVVWHFFRKPGWVLAGFAALIAFSRVYGGVHWSSDVLAGALFGITVGYSFIGLYLLCRYLVPRVFSRFIYLHKRRRKIIKKIRDNKEF